MQRFHSHKHCSLRAERQQLAVGTKYNYYWQCVCAHIQNISNTQSYPNSLVVRTGEQLWAVGGELDTVDPTQVTTEVSHLLISLQVPQLGKKTQISKYIYWPGNLSKLLFLVLQSCVTVPKWHIWTLSNVILLTSLSNHSKDIMQAAMSQNQPQWIHKKLIKIF